ncbi:protein PTST homolog 3, chloroplastic isoform X3 [Syzygium oleosum]|uniref:protein PTST homolog 3, chloroplastic isoform X3 n=1 Tax=Syzygium oleosum TaxID=219896 RepID=UPI0024B9F750|nr:protein PTST homolog 3, chloroplastic isoform X3 [Syzygium oleosum]
MAAPLPHLATCPSSSLSPHRLFFPYRLHRRELRFLSRGCSPGRRSAVCVASAGKSRKTKSNVELCNDVKEFLASAGLPDGHVPSIKELLQHGRDDLAYIIRRRGYKLIRELLANSVEMKVYVSDRETSIAEEKEATIANEEGSEAFCNLKGQNESTGYLDEENSVSVGISVEEDCFDELDINSSSDIAGNSNMHIETPFSLSMKDNTAQDMLKSMIEDTPSSMGTSIVDEISASVDGEPENSFNSNTFMPVETSTNLVTAAKESTTSLGHFEWISTTSEETSLTNSYDHGYTCVEPCAKPSLEEKVAKFMQDGYLEPVEDQLPEVPTEIDDEENQSFTESDMSKPGTELQLETQNGEQSEHAHGESNGAMTPHISTARQFSPAKVHSPFRYSESSVEELFDADVGNNLDEERRKQENQAEISHLKFMLHQKELELSLLKEQNEKEKLALEMLQTKAENEISKAQKIVSEKDAELQAAEESLSGLKEVQIEYSGNGDIVEVAGSFNGWHHPIKMNPHPFATAKDTIGSRRSRYWSTMLWLYPGTYEIKFIVDGEWRIDPQKESVTRGTICNNVLQVDR